MLGEGKGVGKAGRLALLAGCVAAAVTVASPAAAERAPITSSLQSARPAGLAGASATTTIFRISGNPAPNTISVFGDAGGRLVVTSPEGIVEPDGPAPECIQDSPTQVSCLPNYIGAIAGDLSGGSDTFTTQTTLPTLIGISLVSAERPLSGGPGNDRIVGGLGGDLVNGGPGDDALLGFGGGDLLRGESGRDTLSGGGSSDNLMGGSGDDKLQGGASRDLCNGGGGLDTAKSCNVTRKVP
jgi:Ca2+-binding RTX toxin-like protein